MSSMLDLFGKFLARVDRDKLLADIGRMTRLEFGQTADDNGRAADEAASLARDAGLEDVQTLSFPADGKTEFQDKILPLAWNATAGRLTVVSSPEPFPDPVIACYRRHPFHLIMGSRATPPGGLIANIITFEQLLHGEDGDGTLVLLPADKRPTGAALAAVLELGAAGVIVDTLVGRHDAPDSLPWVNCVTVSGRWSHTVRDKSYLGFAVTPRTGDFIRQTAWRGPIIARAESDGRLFAGVHKAVTGVLPGKRPEEIWLIAHLCEPLASDNSSGVVSSIAVAGMIRDLVRAGELPPPEFTLRLAFARELHGFAALAEALGGDLTARVLGAMNVDGMPIDKEVPAVDLNLAPPSAKPFFGNAVMEQLAEDVRNRYPIPLHVNAAGIYGDDASLGDPTIGVPTLWPFYAANRFWHNSIQTVELIDPDLLANSVALCGAWTAATACVRPSDIAELAERAGKILEKRLAAAAPAAARDNDRPGGCAERISHLAERYAAEVEHLAFIGPSPAVERAAAELRRRGGEIISSASPAAGGAATAAAARPEGRRWFDYAASIIPRRLTRGFPHDMAKASAGTPAMRIMYEPIARVLARMDGVKDLRQLIREAEWELGERRPGKETGKPGDHVPAANNFRAEAGLSEKDVSKIVRDVFRLADFGYLAVECREVLAAAALTEELRRLGIKPGDVLVVHSALSEAGRIAGGAEAVLDAIGDAIGTDGTLFMPMFTNSYVYFEGALAISDAYRPFAPGRQPWTGALAAALSRRPGTIRDSHITHSIAGAGRLAAEFLKDVGAFDPPVGAGSVWPKLSGAGGKLVFLGAGLGNATFLHYLEDKLGLPYLGGALARYREADGRTRSAWMPNQLGGHRDFYAGESSRFYQAALARGLRIGRGRFGVGGLLVVECADLERIGLELLRERPDLLLCERPDCQFCLRAREPMSAAPIRASTA